jgi:hypothetical protein
MSPIGDDSDGNGIVAASHASVMPEGNYTFFLKCFLENEFFLDNPNFFGLHFLRK